MNAVSPAMREFLDLDRYPIDRPDSPAGQALVARCRAELARDGMFNLAGLVRPEVIERAAAEVRPLIATVSYNHKRSHNVYFKKTVEGIAPDHPALKHHETSSQTLTGDQVQATVIGRIYDWTPLADFLAAVMEQPRLYLMEDPLARVNVIGYRAGEALNWHFDRSQFTTTLLIQKPLGGGLFEYRSDLRSEADPNYEGVARFIRGEDDQVKSLPQEAGTLNVFKGRNTVHRVTPVIGDRDRIIAVFSYYDRPGVQFSAEERIGFYGRAA
jgi:hypothetical protein